MISPGIDIYEIVFVFSVRVFGENVILTSSPSTADSVECCADQSDIMTTKIAMSETPEI